MRLMFCQTASKVPQNSVIVMDNARFHKPKDILENILSAGCIPEFLPTYSPDLNPIEQTWAQLNSTQIYSPSHQMFC